MIEEKAQGRQSNSPVAFLDTLSPCLTNPARFIEPRVHAPIITRESPEVVKIASRYFRAFVNIPSFNTPGGSGVEDSDVVRVNDPGH